MIVNYDVVVIGGGIAGSLTAIASSRLGVKTLLIEASSKVGGLATRGLVNPLMRYWLNNEELIGGIFKELLVDLKNEGGLLFNSFEADTLSSLLLKKLITSGTDVILNALPYAVETDGSRIESLKLITNIGEERAIKAKYFVDCTGDGSFGYLSGAKYDSGDAGGNNQAVTLMFTMAGVDFNKIKKNIESDRENFFAWVSPKQQVVSVAGYFKEIAKARKDGFKKLEDYFFYIQLPGEGRVTVNTTHVYNPKVLDPFSRATLRMELEEQIKELASFARQYISGFENSRIEKIADTLGVRESRRLKGKMTFTGNDVIHMRKFKDGIVKACYGIDVHKKKSLDNEKNEIPKYGDYYEVPLRALLSSDFENLAMAGRCLSSDFLGQSAARIMPTCAGMGQALGTVLALGLKKDLSPENVEKAEILDTLEKISYKNPKSGEL